jgi:hypothetical protein
VARCVDASRFALPSPQTFDEPYLLSMRPRADVMAKIRNDKPAESRHGPLQKEVTMNAKVVETAASNQTACCYTKVHDSHLS